MSEDRRTPNENQALAAATSDRVLAFQVRPIPFEIADTEYRLSAATAQAILKEVNRLPRISYPLAEEIARQIDRTLRDGSSVRFGYEQARTLLVVIERIRLRSGRLPTDLSPLREALLGAPVTAA
jgi:hypothetical protein